MEETKEFADIDLKTLEANKDSDTISRLIDTWEQKIRSSDAVLQIVSEDMMLISKEVVRLRNDLSNKRQEQLELENTVRKGLHNLRQLKSEKSEIERTYWRAK